MTAWQDYSFPRVIAEKTAGEAFETDSVGRSDSAVLLFADKALKIEKTSSVSDNEYAILQWLDGGLRAPRVLAFARENGFNYLLMTRLEGKMAFASDMTPEEISARLAEGLKLLRSTDISDCPCRRTFFSALKEAKKRMDDGELKALSPQTEEFPDFESLYAYLEANIPEEEPVFSHGDYCLPNVFLSDEEPCGFLDLGNAGIADKWYDIHMFLWSLWYNFCELGGMSEDDFASCKTLFFEALSLEPNAEKLRYHALMDEFFM